MNRTGTARLIGILISIASLAGVILWAIGQPAPELPSTPSALAAALGAVCIYGVATGLRAERWHALLRAESGHPARADSYALTAVGFMGNNVLPARAGDGFRIYLMAPRAGLRMRQVAGTLIAERVLDVIVLVGLFFLLAYGLLGGIETPGGPSVALSLAVIAAVLLVVGAAIFASTRSERGRSVLEFVKALVRPTGRLRGKAGLSFGLITLAIWAAEAGSYMLAGASVGIDLSALDALYVIAVAGVFLLVPAGPGYVGTLDAALLFGLDAVGEHGGDALSFLIMVRFLLFVPITAVGFIVLVARYGGMPGITRADEVGT